MQLSALAISRAVEVLPTPRTPVIRKACASRSRSIALASVGPSHPARSARRRSAGGICARARDRAGGEFGHGSRGRGKARRTAMGIAGAMSKAAPHQSKARGGGSRNDPGRNRCGCFLPDLTRLATSTVRPTSAAHMAQGAALCKRRRASIAPCMFWRRRASAPSALSSSSVEPDLAGEARLCA